jgi:hypothetical protein
MADSAATSVPMRRIATAAFAGMCVLALPDTKDEVLDGTVPAVAPA